MNSLTQHNKKSRIEYLDIAKGLLILLVIRGHLRISFLPEFFHEDSFYRIFHVSAFLVLGGVLLKDELLDNPKETIRKKYHSLFKKAFYFFLAATLLHNVFLNVGLYPYQPGNVAFNYYEGIWDWTVAIGKALTGMSFEPMVQPAWFALTLFFAIVFISFLQWLLKKMNRYSELRMVTILIALCVISCLIAHCAQIPSPKRIMSAVSSMILVYLGHLYWKYSKSHFSSMAIFIVCLFLNIGITYTIGLNSGFMALIANQYNDPLTLIIGGLSGTYIVCYIGKWLEGTKVGKVLAVCGRESFYLMAMHIFFFRCLGLFIGKYIGINISEWEFHVGFIGFATLFFGSILLTLLFCWTKNKMAKLYSR